MRITQEIVLPIGVLARIHGVPLGEAEGYDRDSRRAPIRITRIEDEDGIRYTADAVPSDTGDYSGWAPVDEETWKEMVTAEENEEEE